MNQDKITYLEMLQTVIARMASNSFHIKGWTISLIPALLALMVSKEELKEYSWFLLIPLVLFWMLDAYYLWQEQLYRKLYQRVVCSEECNHLFSMNPSEFKQKGWPEWMLGGKVFRSNTLLIFYLPLLILILIIWCHGK